MGGHSVFAAILAATLSLTTGPAVAASQAGKAAQTSTSAAADETVAAFEWFCLSNLNNAKGIPALFSDIKVKPLTQEQARPFLAGLPGKVWFLPGDSARLVVSLTDRGVCSVVNTEVKGLQVKATFEKQLKMRVLSTDKIGTETHYAYAVSHPDQRGGKPIHAVVFVQVSNLSSIPGVNLSAVPERLLAEQGMSAPKWP